MSEQRPSVLVVDDDQGPREVLIKLLEDFCEVRGVRDGTEALARLKQQPSDVITLDLKMPGMSGLELLRELKKFDCPTEAVIITGFGTLETAQEAMRLGACRYLTKPFRRHELRQAVRDAIAHRKRNPAEPINEIENSDQVLLANLYAANHQLHTTLDFKEVVETIKEIVINMIGGDMFVLLLYDEQKKRLYPINGHRVEWRHIPSVSLGEGLIGKVLAENRPWYCAGNAVPSHTTFIDPRIVLPLRFKDRIMGAIAIYSLLEHKTVFSELDLQLCELLTETMATALFSSKLYAESERKLNTLKGFLDLMKL